MKDRAENIQKAIQSRGSGWIQYLLSPVIVGLVVLFGQSFIAPIVAERVKTKESILEQKYKACENAVDILQRRLASVPITGTLVPEWYTPPEKTPPTQLEMNTAYTLLVIYCKSETIAAEFFAATGPGKTDPSDIAKFISAVRKELGVDEEGFTGELQYRFLRPVDANKEQDKE